MTPRNWREPDYAPWTEEAGAEIDAFVKELIARNAPPKDPWDATPAPDAAPTVEVEKLADELFGDCSVLP